MFEDVQVGHFNHRSVLDPGLSASGDSAASGDSVNSQGFVGLEDTATFSDFATPQVSITLEEPLDTAEKQGDFQARTKEIHPVQLQYAHIFTNRNRFN